MSEPADAENGYYASLNQHSKFQAEASFMGDGARKMQHLQ